MNYWFWLYIVLVPVLVFSATPRTHHYWQLGRLLFSIAITYLLINLAVHLKWDLINAQINTLPKSTAEDFQHATADGANLIFTLIFGWLPAIAYVGWCEAVWRIYYRNTLKHVQLRARVSASIVWLSLIIGFAVGIFAVQYDYPTSLGIFFQLLLPPIREAY